MKKILIVDDSTAIRNILKTALFGDYELLEAENGEVALNMANKNAIELFLLDVNMPVMDGLTLVKELRKVPKYKTSPIIMLTTESRDEKKKQGK
ncbi:MAG: response regulator, partial [Spirochaetes bacterium]|nr:response regulator [Spirochaetota bacterium]